MAAQLREAVSACGAGTSAPGSAATTSCSAAACRRWASWGGYGAGVDRTGFQPHPIVDGRFAANNPAPVGPAVEIFPGPGPQPGEPGFLPGPAGPGPLITVPAPGLGTGFQDGPGSGQRVDEPGRHVDRQGDTTSRR